ncbi:MAG: sulfate adenylyltransferase subunit CysN [Legionella sp.]|nr:MAG: sulfate adenylyltransferase subunit CysN [Legionella sp.]
MLKAALKERHQEKDLLRFITCGSVDDGKSTLIGRILYEAQLIHEDQLLALAKDSKRFGTTEDALDLALLMDGLISEREQGITIDVAYRYFTTNKRKFIVADTPGHEQYTRNMATGASTAQAAVVLVDVRKGISTQTKRHSFILNLLGVKQIVLAVNKMDLVDYDAVRFTQIKDEYQEFMKSLGVMEVYAIPVSALKGVNITQKAQETPWYFGFTLMDYLEQVPNEDILEQQAFRMPVQWVNRPHQDFRGFAGRIAAGTIRPGDSIRILPGQQHSTVQRIVSYSGDLPEASIGQSITLTLADELDISRGNMFVDSNAPADTADQFSIRLLWMSEVPMVSARQYLFKAHSVTASCTLSKPKHRIDINTLKPLHAEELQLNEIGDFDLFLDRLIPFEAYAVSRELGGFILIDRLTQATVAAGFIQSALKRAPQVPEQVLLVDKAQRVAIKGHKPVVLWFTGLSGAGKSTLANRVELELNAIGKHSMLLDGDHIRHVLNRDLDFSTSGRAENIRRISEIAKLMTDAGLITLVSFISPFRAERDMAKERIGADQFLEIFVDVSLDVAESRDVKGLYKKARAGMIENFTGISSPYEAPQSPDLRVDTAVMSLQDSVDRVMTLLKERGFI